MAKSEIPEPRKFGRLFLGLPSKLYWKIHLATRKHKNSNYLLAVPKKGRWALIYWENGKKLNISKTEIQGYFVPPVAAPESPRSFPKAVSSEKKSMPQSTRKAFELLNASYPFRQTDFNLSLFLFKGLKQIPKGVISRSYLIEETVKGTYYLSTLIFLINSLLFHSSRNKKFCSFNKEFFSQVIYLML